MYKSEFRLFLIYYKMLTKYTKETFSKDYNRIYVQGGKIFGEKDGQTEDLTEKLLANLIDDDLVF